MKHPLSARILRRKTKPLLSELSALYLVALGNYVKKDPPSDLQQAHTLGEKAVTDGLEILDLAKIHDQALMTLLLPDASSITRKDLTQHAGIFFTEAITPIEKTHPLVLNTCVNLKQLKAELLQQTDLLKAANSALQQGIKLRQTSEAALKTSSKIAAKRLTESQKLHERLQERTRQLIAAQEEERRIMSLRLQEEIAQSLLGIQVRLLALKKEAALSNHALKKEIAITQRLLEKLVRAIKRSAREFGMHHEK